MLQPISELPQEIQLQNIIRDWTAICLETGAHLSRSQGRPKWNSAPKYILILPNKSIEERGGLFARYIWDYPAGRKFIRAWSDTEAIEEANRKLEKMLAKRQEKTGNLPR